LPIPMDGNCAICQDTWDDVASALPCGHLFCQVCILQWAQINPVCPLCRRTIDTVRFSDNTDKSLEIVWARLFRRQRELLDPVRTWLRQRTETVCG
uniref:RING-type domain-containing protein n=1 Tax=Ficedula albicollis TaxID=59894 RepID=U3KK95_FICAL